MEKIFPESSTFPTATKSFSEAVHTRFICMPIEDYLKIKKQGWMTWICFDVGL